MSITADIIHLLSDACTKKHVGVFHVNVKLEVKNADGVSTQDLPLKFKVLLSHFISTPPSVLLI